MKAGNFESTAGGRGAGGFDSGTGGFDSTTGGFDSATGGFGSGVGALDSGTGDWAGDEAAAVADGVSIDGSAGAGADFG